MHTNHVLFLSHQKNNDFKGIIKGSNSLLFIFIVQVAFNPTIVYLIRSWYLQELF